MDENSLQQAASLNHRPTVTTSDGTVQEGQSISVASLVRISDSDGNSTIKEIYLADDGVGGGYLRYNGRSYQNTGSGAQLLTLTSLAELSRVEFVAGAGGQSDTIRVNAYDGVEQAGGTGAFKFTVTTTAVPKANHRPTVTTSDGTVQEGQSINVASLVRISDSDGDSTIKEIYLADDGIGGGYLRYNGRSYQNTGSGAQLLTLTSLAELSKVEFVAGAGGQSDTIRVNAYDGVEQAGGTGAFKFTVTTTAAPKANHRPTVTTSDGTVQEGKSISLASLVRISDSDGDSTIKEIYLADDGVEGGYLRYNGRSYQNTGSGAQLLTLTSLAELSKVEFVAGAGGQSDTIRVNAYDGVEQAGGTGAFKFTVNTTAAPDTPTPKITLLKKNSDVIDNGGSIRLSDLFQISSTIPYTLSIEDKRAGYIFKDGQKFDGLKINIPDGNINDVWFRPTYGLGLIEIEATVKAGDKTVTANLMLKTENQLEKITTPSNTLASYVTSDARWSNLPTDPDGRKVITYSFPTVSSRWEYGHTDNPLTKFRTVTDKEKTAINKALDKWENVSNIHFVEKTGDGEEGKLQFLRSSYKPETNPVENLQIISPSPDLLGARTASGPNNSQNAGDVWLGETFKEGTTDIAENSSQFRSIIHEIGHAIGLKHPHDGTPIADYSIDLMSNSIMSYRGTLSQTTPSTFSNQQGSFPSTPMVWDIIAVQNLYGINTSYHNDKDVYSLAAQYAGQSVVFETLFDSGGTDTIDLSSTTQATSIDLSPGGWVRFDDAKLARLDTNDLTNLAQGNVRLAFPLTDNDTRFLIENAVGGSGNDLITGNNVSNLLTGGSGNDTLRGGGGNDTAVFSSTTRITLQADGTILATGSDGTDVLESIEFVKFGSASAVSVESVLQVGSAAVSSASATLSATQQSLVLTGLADLSGTGNDLDNLIIGNGGSNTLSGAAGNDRIIVNGAGGIVNGGAGNDLVTIASSGSTLTITDVETLIGGSGMDFIALGGSNQKIIMAAVETLIGGSGQDQIALGNRGNTMILAAVETLTGGSGFDQITLGNRGGSLLVSGIEKLSGGSGIDVVTLANGNTTIVISGIETLVGSSGVDTVAFAGNRENYSLTRNASTVTVSGAGAVTTLTNVEHIAFANRQEVGSAPSFQATADSLALASQGQSFTLRQLAIVETEDPSRGTLATKVTINGADIAGVPATLKKGWKVGAISDIDGDGKGEAFFFGLSEVDGVGAGYGATWEMGASGAVETSVIQLSMGKAGWDVAGTANINGLVGDEILWQNTLTGEKGLWTDTNHDGKIDQGYLLNELGTNTSTRIVGLADLDKDNLWELMLYDDRNGSVSIFEATPSAAGSVLLTQQNSFLTFSAFQSAAIAAGASYSTFGIIGG